MHEAIVKLHCTETECGNCAHHTNIAHCWVSTPWCTAFRTYIEEGKRSRYCLEAERDLVELREAKPAPDKG